MNYAITKEDANACALLMAVDVAARVKEKRACARTRR
jgi:hypothetical protein